MKIHREVSILNACPPHNPYKPRNPNQSNYCDQPQQTQATQLTNQNTKQMHETSFQCGKKCRKQATTGVRFYLWLVDKWRALSFNQSQSEVQQNQRKRKWLSTLR